MKYLKTIISKNAIIQKVEDNNSDFLDCADIVKSWKNGLILKQEDIENGAVGLRNPQIGAVYSILSHWTHSNQVGTIVMPTGTGKTETMLSVLVMAQVNKLLIIVPTDPLRKQISEKFINLGLLYTLGLLDRKVLFPVVGVIKSNFDTEENANLFFQKCNVVVATASIISRVANQYLSVLKNHLTGIFIDEAHHTEATTWNNFRENLKDKKIIQFTATPFRNDDKMLGGKIIFNYPLRKAQEEGYFKKIDFIKLHHYGNQIEKDKAIAETAIKQLRIDKAKFPHILLARVGKTKRANEVFEIYKLYDEFRVVKIHSQLPSREKTEIYNKIINKEIDIIICVDMLGEGFDLPELKIAAFHDIRKSLPITLQFIGRFTRTKYDEELGNATIIANVADLEVTNELEDLYAQDVDWNILLPNISQDKTQKEIDLYEFLNGFSNLEEFPLSIHSLKPAQSTVVFKNNTESWFPSNFKQGLQNIDGYDLVRHSINLKDQTLIILTAKKNLKDWVNSDNIFDFSWNLHIVYWETKKNLLFIHSSDTKSLHIDLAKAIIGEDAQIINGENDGAIFRVLSGIKRLKLQNVGLVEVLGKLIRFQMRVGSDIEAALSQTQINNSKKSFIFGSGYENGVDNNIGCSYKGRIWCKRKTNLSEFINWCKQLGNKITDTTIDSEEVLRGTLMPKAITQRPNLFPFCIDWSEEFYLNSELRYTFIINNITYDFYNVSLVLVNPSNTNNIKLGFEVDGKIILELELEIFTNPQNFSDYRFIKTNPQLVAQIKFGTKEQSIENYFYENPPVVWFANGDFLEGNNYIELKSLINPYNKELIQSWNWTGIDLSIESQGVNPKKANSIQYRSLEILKAIDYDIIYDDDGSGEIADIVTFKILDDKIEVELYHIKYSKSGKVDSQISNLYEVCGQAQKSVNWKFKKNKEFLEHLLRREIKKEKTATCSRFEKGTKDDLVRILDLVHSRIPLEFKIYIIQPSISKATVTEQQLTLFGVTENYLMDRALIKLNIIGSA
ncbi:DEAD/DEAH box helicase [Flavobacterium geliluteum]|uniref:DEAD/DEAH box helicase family protein n=1 Tax=Flavobacterium geliluteum TaxID=2816120 RepID=A0A940X7V8_9FLAO|nr:DEAD/DEAH box helicase family protein [Flavobacterium geliluteum]MBP4136701.1 DEAD/DEAH box helicase family protein [Flavobacterium geliluteum]